MELNKTVNSFVRKALAFEGAAEQTIESDITLPDYFPDIVKIIRCTIRPNIMSVNTAQNQLSVEGNCILSVLYLSEESKLRCFEQRLPFSKLIDVRRTEDCIFCTDASGEYVNCRVLSQRRIDIHASISISYKAYCRQCTNYFNSCDEQSVQTNSQSVNICNLQDFNCKYFNVNETLEINNAQPTINQIVKSDAQVVMQSAKVITGKILIKGNLTVQILYLSDNDNQLQRIENTVPISQILEIGATDESLEFVNLSVSGLEVFAKTDSSGALRLVDLSASIRADIAVYECTQGEIVNDVYSTRYLLDAKREEASLSQLGEQINESFLVRGEMDINDDSVLSVLDLSVDGIKSEYSYSNGRLTVRGSISLVALLETGQQGIRSVERQIEFEYAKNILNDGEEISAEYSLSSTAVTYTIQSENKLDIRAELEINGVLFNIVKMPLITDIAINDNALKDKAQPMLTVYFADRGERIWDIAKKYNTTAELIMQENDLSVTELENSQRLLIPTI